MKLLTSRKFNRNRWKHTEVVLPLFLKKGKRIMMYMINALDKPVWIRRRCWLAHIGGFCVLINQRCHWINRLKISKNHVVKICSRQRIKYRGFVRHATKSALLRQSRWVVSFNKRTVKSRKYVSYINLVSNSFNEENCKQNKYSNNYGSSLFCKKLFSFFWKRHDWVAFTANQLTRSYQF